MRTRNGCCSRPKVVVLDTLAYINCSNRPGDKSQCPPEYLEVKMMRDNNMRPSDMGVESPVSVGTWLGWCAAMIGEQRALAIKAQQDEAKRVAGFR